MSSFIYDKDLVSKLIKSAIDHDNKFNKKAQQNFTTDYWNLTKKLVENLENNLFPSSGITSGNNENVALNVSDFSSFNNLLDFITNNQIMVNGQRVSYKAGEENPDSKKYLPIASQASPEQVAYYVNRDLLSKYLNFIVQNIAKEDPETQNILKPLVNSRLQEINQIFKTKLTTEYKEPTKEINLPDNTVIDKLPQNLEMTSKTFPQGNINLTIADLKSIEAFNGWISKNQITLKTNSKIMSYDDRDYNYCNFIGYLYERSKVFSYRADFERKDLFSGYFNAVQKLASIANCNISNFTNNQNNAGNQSPEQSAPNPGLYLRLASMHPFNSQRINFTDIQAFVDNYVKFDPSSQNIADQINTSIESAKNELGGSLAPFPIDNLTTTKVNDYTTHPIQLLDYLITILTYTARLYSNLYNYTKDQLEKDHPDLIRGMEQQIASGGAFDTAHNTILRVRENFMNQVGSGNRR